MFGHFTSTIELEGDERFSDFSLGEHDLFVNSKITPKISFLGETQVAPLNSHGYGSADFKVSMERAAEVRIPRVVEHHRGKDAHPGQLLE